MKRVYGIYEVQDIFKPDGSWSGYRCSVIDPKELEVNNLVIESDIVDNDGDDCGSECCSKEFSEFC